MAHQGLLPELVLCSPARRALDTWNLVSESLGSVPQVEVLEDLYHTSPGTLLALIRELSDSIDSVLLVGHNPTFEELALTLAAQGDRVGLEEMARKYPTGALAVIDFPIERWGEVQAGSGSLRVFTRPRDLRP
jgi:phosphohistidine phosphatase